MVQVKEALLQKINLLDQKYEVITVPDLANNLQQNGREFLFMCPILWRKKTTHNKEMPNMCVYLSFI